MAFSVVGREHRRTQIVEMRCYRADDFMIRKAEEKRDAKALETD